MKRTHVILSLLLLCLAADGAAQSRRSVSALRSNPWRIAVEGGVGVLGDDNTRDSRDYYFRPIGGLEIAKVVNENIVIGAYFGGGSLRSTTLRREAQTDFMVGGLLTEFRASMFRGSLYPLLQLRGGVLAIKPELRIDDVTSTDDLLWQVSWSAAAGVEVVSWRVIGVRVLFGVAYTSTDRWDMLVRGTDRDGYSFATVGLTWYLTSRR